MDIVWIDINEYTSLTATELVGPSKRHIVGFMLSTFWVFSCLILEGYAVGIRNHINLQIVSTVLVACTIPLIW